MGEELLTICRLDDPAVEAAGHPVDGLYPELFWLPVLGPSCLWLLRHAARFTTVPATSPYVVEVEVLARSLGIGGHGPWSVLRNAFVRLERNSCARWAGGNEWELRTHLDRLPGRYLRRLPAPLKEAHERYVAVP